MTTATELGAVKRRITCIDQWLHGPADTFGECDQCHNATIPLWEDLQAAEDGDEGGWSYCRKCWEGRLQRHRNRLADMLK